MANVRNPARPLSPHLTIWKWGPHMTVSILHRVTGGGLATVGAVLFIWWLAALAGGEASYAVFLDVFTYTSGKLNIIGWIMGVGLTLAFFQHMANGIRHLFLDQGAIFELKTNRVTSLLTFVSSVVLTAGFWALLLLEK